MKDKPVERDVDRMRELLARTPPDDPGTAGRADAVVARARRSRARKRRGVIGGVAVAAFAAAVIVTPHFLKTSPTTNEATDPDNGVEVTETASDPVTTDPCPADPIDVSIASSVSPLPSGAESVRLCRAVTSPLVGAASKQDLVSSWSAPPEAVVASPDAFVDAIDAAPSWSPDQCAAADWVDDPFAVVVTYADETVVIGAPAPVCNPIQIGGREVGSDVVVAAYVDALEAQAASVPPPQLSRPVCGPVDEQKLSTFEVNQLSGPAVAGIVCYTVDPQGAREYAEDRGVLTRDQLHAIETDMAANREATRGFCTDTGPTRVVRLVDERGNVTAWVDDRCTGDFASPTGIWSPSDAGEQIIADALGGRVD